tara:strand:+ start:361 stop:1071 length:711 start_codon:yes stop_codon:yes gene_type:complete
MENSKNNTVKTINLSQKEIKIRNQKFYCEYCDKNGHTEINCPKAINTFLKKRNRDVDDNEINLDGIDADNIIKTRRRRISLKSGFESLLLGNVEDFLNNPMIKTIFDPVMTLLGDFGHGTNVNILKQFWKLLWYDDLIIEKQKKLTTNICIACNANKSLKYKIIQKSSNELLGIMGIHCYEIKFISIINLVKCCKDDILLDIYRADFESNARDLIMTFIVDIQNAPRKMKLLYSRK